MVDLDSLTDEERNAYANLAQSLSPKSREALALHVSGWTRSNVEARGCAPCATAPSTVVWVG